MNEASTTRRLFATIGTAAVFVAVGRFVHVPDFAPGLLDLAVPNARANTLGVLALGVTPWVRAWVLVELVAQLVPALARRRDAPDLDARLDRAARILGLVFAAFQAYGVALQLQALARFAPDHDAEDSVPVVTLTLLGGACASLVLSDLVSRQRLVNGMVLLLAATDGAELVGVLRDAVGRAALLGEISPANVVFALAALALPCAATWWALRRALPPAGERDGAPGSPYRDGAARAFRPWLPLPAGSLAVFTVVATLLSLPSLLERASDGARRVQEALERSITYDVVELGLAAALAFGLGRLLSPSPPILALARRLGFAVGEDAEARVAEARRAALGPTLVYLAVLIAAGHLLRRVNVSISVLVLPRITAVMLDVVRGARDAGSVAVVEDRRPWALALYVEALEARGIPTRTGGTAVSALLQAFAPFGSARVLVAEADAPRAREILDALAGGRDPSPPRPAASRSPAARREASRRIGAVVFLGAVVLLGALAVFYRARHMPAPANGEGRERVSFQVLTLDDATKVLDDLPDAELPPGVELSREMVSNGPGDRVVRHYLHVPLQPGEPVDAAFRRAEAVAHANVPGDIQLLWGTLEAPDEANQLRTNAIRSYVAGAEVLLREGDVAEARADVDNMGQAMVRITLTPAAGTAFAEATARLVQRRVAIVVDRRVTAAPVIRSAITGGSLAVTTSDVAAAKALAARLAP